MMGAGIGAAIILAILGLNTARNAAGWQPITHSPAERQAILAPAWRMITPETPGPHKAAILLSGCDGIRDNMDHWAQVMLKQDRAVMILDSHSPRKLDVAQSWRAVCAGQILPGAERAGDLAVALTALARMPGIDPTGTAILGASHGGWTAMELLTELNDSEPPPGLSAWPAKPHLLSAMIGPVVLLYPYCGLISRGDQGRWPERAEGLMILAQNDSITDPEACHDMADRIAGKGADLNVVTFRDMDHGFDQRDRSSLSPLEFNRAARDKATALVTDFLEGSGSGPPGL